MQPHNARATASLVVSPSVKTFFDSSVSPLIENVLHRCGWLGRPPVVRRHCHLDGPLGTGVHHQTRWRPVLPRTGHTHRPAGSARIVWSRAGQPWVDDADPATHPGPRTRIPHRPGTTTQRRPHHPKTTPPRRTHRQRRPTTTVLMLSLRRCRIRCGCGSGAMSPWWRNRARRRTPQVPRWAPASRSPRSPSARVRRCWQGG